MNTKLLTETADYDTPGSWGSASNGWPEFHDPDEKIRRFAIRTKAIPYGSYVTVDSKFRVHPDFYGTFQKAMLAAAPSPGESA